MSSILDALRRIEREEGGNPQIFQSQLDADEPVTGAPARRIWTGAAVAALLMCTGAVALWLSGTRVTRDERAEVPSSSDWAQATRVAAVAAEEGTDPRHGEPAAGTSAGKAASPRGVLTATGETRSRGAAETGPVGKQPVGGPPVGDAPAVGPDPATRPVPDERRSAGSADSAAVGRKRAALAEGVPSSSRQADGRAAAETDRSVPEGLPAPSSEAGSAVETASEPADRTPGNTPPVTSGERPSRSLGNSSLREKFAATLSERMKTAQSPVSPVEQPPPVAKDPTRQVSRSEVGALEPTIQPSSSARLKEAKLHLPDSEVRSERPAHPKADTKPGRKSKGKEEAVQRHRPPGAPYVRVSFLFYSSEPTRRRVMVTVNDGSLVTLFEGQTTDDLEVERILRDEVHFRYQGKLFAVRPRS